MLMIGATGKLMTRNGKLFDDVNGTDCCCGTPICTCEEFCATPHGRITFQSRVCEGDPDITTCKTSAVYLFDFVEADPGTIPDVLPCEDAAAITRYWVAQPTMDCAIPEDPRIELACCTQGGLVHFEVRINGVAWCGISDECVKYLAHASIAAEEISTDPTCCGPAFLQIWCDGFDIGTPNCDLVGTGTCG